MLETIGVSALTLVLGIFGGGFFVLRFAAPRTETTWDDKALDVIEGVANYLELDPDELAAKSYGNLKKKLIINQVKKGLT
jgi:hypothetical protein